MLDTIKWQENFRIKEQPNIQKAYATIINSMRWIIYDNEFLESLDTYASTKWASISVLAHEIGHHYYNHVIKNQGSTHPATHPSWIALYMQSPKTETVQLSDDGRNYQPAKIKAGEPFVFKFEVFLGMFIYLKYQTKMKDAHRFNVEESVAISAQFT
jgi:hypothetical protein